MVTFSQALPSVTGLHMGKLIRNEIVNQNMSLSEFADRINCCRSNVYDLMARPSVDCAQLMKISLALNVNFFSLLEEEFNRKAGK